MTFRISALALLAALVVGLSPVAAENETPPRPFVKGGISDKPFIAATSNRARVGGYMEAHFRYERVDGITEELRFEPKRFNIFTFAPVSDRVRVASELEFEEGGEEIKIEIAVLDFELHPAVTFRGGIILSPLGRFNLAHDSPTNELTDRPLVSTKIIPTALSEAGMGVYGAWYPTPQSRVTYEFYGVNGFGDGVILGDPEGTRISAGKGNLEDNNNRPAWVGRLGFSPAASQEVGLSVHTGPYNTWMAEDLTIDEKRNLSILALDWEWTWNRFDLLGEYARASIDVPAETAIFAESQEGVYVQANARFGRGLVSRLPDSNFTAVVRLGEVDFDADASGDSQRRLTLGCNFRPTPDTVFKLDYQRNSSTDPFDNEVKGAALLFSVASYF